MSTLESLRVYRASKITLNFTSKVLDDNIQAIDEILLRNRLDVNEINMQLRQAEDPQTVVQGCSLNMIIDNQLIKLRNDRYRYLPSDDLIEGIRDLAGVMSVRVAY